MANKNPSEKTRFKKGLSGNPNGRPPLPEEVKGLKRLDKEAFDRLLNKTIHMTREELQGVINNRGSTMIELWLAKGTEEGFLKGDLARLEVYLNRAIGSVKSQVEHSGRLTLEDLVTQSLE